jgi:hypothetical protein
MPELQVGPDGGMESITLRGCEGDCIQLVREFVTGRQRVREAEEKAARDPERFNEEIDKMTREAAERSKD